jgi:hypothetical protein
VDVVWPNGHGYRALGHRCRPTIETDHFLCADRSHEHVPLVLRDIDAVRQRHLGSGQPLRLAAWMPFDQPAGDSGRDAGSGPVGLVPHSGRDEATVGKPGDAVVVTVLLQNDAAFPGQHRRGAGEIEIVDLDGLACTVTRRVQTEAPRRRFGQAEAVGVEGLQVQRSGAVGVGTCVVLQLEGGTVDEL